MMTGEEYRESLRDGRKVYCQGERIDDVTTHPLTKLAVDWIVRGYDEHYDPTAECGPYFTIPRSVEELRNTEERDGGGVDGAHGGAVLVRPELVAAA